ncbi:MAG: response regulator, partial [Planctomycetota bacterium]
TVYRTVRTGDRVRGVLAIDILVKDLASDYLAAALVSSQHACIVGADGVVLASEGPAADWSGLEATRSVAAGFRGTTSGELNGDRMRLVFEPQKDTTLGMVVAVPYSTFLAPADSMRNVLVLVTLGGFVLVATVGFWLVRRAVQPVRELSQGAALVAEGQLDQTLEIRVDDEIGTLAENFNLMTRNLRSTRGELLSALEEKDRRADELEGAYKNLQETQRQLAQAEKMGLLGQLAGGIAHDFNNLLGGIMGCADLLRRRGAVEKDRIRYADMILETGQRAADLVRQLLSFARPGPADQVAVDVHDLIGEVVRILRHTIDPGIVVREELRAARAVVEGDPSELQRALLNIGVNARDAMPDGGRLTFSTADIDLDAETCQRLEQSIEPGRYLEVGIADTGAGMTKDVLAHVFEPFYTTKGVGEGTGLGLAAVYGTVCGHGGAIHVYSEPGHGSQFKFFLPLTEAAAAAAAASGPTDVVHGTGTVLVVDDEAVIRNLAGDMLRFLGYDVLFADSGSKALDICGREEVDLVILDFVMPGMDGAETLRELRKLDASVKVLIASGFHLDVNMGDLRREGAAGFIGKPFIVASLSRAVARALDTTPQPQQGLRILVADDSAVNREVLAAQLDELGHDPFVVEDGEKAVDAVERERFDMVLMDFEMPGMSGCEAAAAIRAHGHVVPIVAITGHGSDSDRGRCDEAGMVGFLEKPVVIEALRAEIARVVPRTEPPTRPAGDDLPRRLAAAFAAEAPRLLKDLRAAAKGGDADALHRAAHTLYGSLRHFEAPRASEIADQLQNLGRNGSIDEAEPLANALQAECEQLIAVQSGVES